MRIITIVVLVLVPTLARAQIGWAPPTLVTELNSTASDTGPHLSADGLTVYFASYRTTNWEIWTATRPGRGVPWTPPVLETAVNSSSVDDSPFLTADGLELWFVSSRTGGTGGSDIMRATRPAVSAAWNPPGFVTELNSTAAEGAPSLTADGLEVYFLSAGLGAPAAPNNAVFRATRASVALPFGTPALLTEVLNSNTHRDVAISGDGLTLLYTEFVSPRIKVLATTRLNRTSVFGTPVELTEFAGVGPSLGVYSVAPSTDLTEILIAAGFPTASGSQEIMTARFTGLTHSGIASPSSTMALNYRDPAGAGQLYVFAASLGTTGFYAGPWLIPLDYDGLFSATLGTSYPPYSTGFLGVLNADGVGTATLSDPGSLLAGAQIWIAAATAVPTAPSGIQLVSNAVLVEIQ